jgi:ferrochelatase
LQSLLRQRGIDATSYVAMRYWHPFTESAVADIKADGMDQVVVLPLYPHFSISTSGSSFRELQRLRQGDNAFEQLPDSLYPQLVRPPRISAIHG